MGFPRFLAGDGVLRHEIGFALAALPLFDIRTNLSVAIRLSLFPQCFLVRTQRAKGLARPQR